MTREPTSAMVSTRLTAILLWVFPLTYLIHIAEEYWGGEGYPAYILRLRGVHLSTTRFLAAQSVGFVLVTIGVLLARKLHFPQMMLLVMGTIVLVNALTHTATALTSLTYGPGLISSILVWMPLGFFILIKYRRAVSRKKYLMAIATGVGVNLAIAFFTMRGGRIV